MNALLALSRAIDALNERVGRTVYWLVLAAVLISAGNAIVRKLFDVSSNAFLEIQWYLFSVDLPVLRRLHAAAQRARAHRRHRGPAVDARAGLDRHPRHALLPAADGDHHHVAVVAGVRRTYARNEVSTNAGGLIIWPARLMVPIGFFLLVMQGVSELIKRIAFLRGLIPDPAQKQDEKTRRGGAGRGDPAAARGAGRPRSA